MPQLVAFVIKNLTIGALIGLAVACWLLATGAIGSHLPSGSDAYIAIGMLAYSMATTFALGFLATSLLLLE